MILVYYIVSDIPLSTEIKVLLIQFIKMKIICMTNTYTQRDTVGQTLKRDATSQSEFAEESLKKTIKKREIEIDFKEITTELFLIL